MSPSSFRISFPGRRSVSATLSSGQLLMTLRARLSCPSFSQQARLIDVLQASPSKGRANFFEPAAFMSYVHFDDEHDHGQLTEFRKRLSGEVRMQTGDDFAIFQDRDHINWEKAGRRESIARSMRRCSWSSSRRTISGAVTARMN